jgi:hypothetical protein
MFVDRFEPAIGISVTFLVTCSTNQILLNPTTAAPILLVSISIVAGILLLGTLEGSVTLLVTV